MSRPMAPLYDTVEQVESRGNQNAVSPKGARGVMQLMPGTMRDPGFGVTPPRDNSEAENRRAGREYLDAMHNRYGDKTTALMAYNWGPGNVDRWIKNGRNPNAVPAETKNYVAKITGSKAMPMDTTDTNQPVLLQVPQQRDPVAPALAPNPNAAAVLAQPQPGQPSGPLTDAMAAAALAPQTRAIAATPEMQMLDTINNRIDANVLSAQRGVVGPEAAKFAADNNLALNDPRVLAFAADRNVSPLQKGLSFLQGVVGLPFGILGNALGEKIDYTSAFTPEKTYRTRAQQAINALDQAGLEAKAEIAKTRGTTLSTLAQMIQPAVKEAYQFSENQQFKVGDNIDNKVLLDALVANGYVTRDGMGRIVPDTSSPAAQNFILKWQQQSSIANSTGKTSEIAAGLAAAGALAGQVSGEYFKANQKGAGELGVKAYEDITTRGRVADGLVPKLDFLIAQSQKFGNQYAGFTGDVRKWVQEAGAGLGLDPRKYEGLSEAQVFDSVANDVGLVQAQRMPGTLAAQELAVALSIAGTYKDTATARDAKLSTMRAGAKAEQAQRDAAMRFYRRNDNVFDEAAFRDSDEFKSVANRPLWYYDRKLLPTMVAGDRQRYSNFAKTRDGKLVVQSGGKTYDVSKLTNDQLVGLVGK